MGKKVTIGTVKIKRKCCVSKKRCSSCPIRVLAEGRMPEGYTVRKRKLVTVAVTSQAGSGTRGKSTGKATAKGPLTPAA